MRFCKADAQDFDTIYEMMLRARKKLFEEQIYQWDERYPKPEMIASDLENGFTTIVSDDEGRAIAFFTSNSICEDDVHDDVRWIYSGDKWIILHRLCVEPGLQGSGIGQQILKMFEKESVDSGYDSIRIDVFSTNACAIHIYEKFGYVRVGEALCERGSFFIYEKIVS